MVPQIDLRAQREDKMIISCTVQGHGVIEVDSAADPATLDADQAVIALDFLIRGMSQTDIAAALKANDAKGRRMRQYTDHIHQLQHQTA
ncbi:hypothetical protein A3C20_03625 [Candidatus Kaiserbacteria bacterium RIFCSPHIGHO2_02_FULL_55_25]|uniref:Uncharacterized protein n=1 Tax=Candidatus Kaiserbacteria bacterium RIFCSPHIGHO2_02_FULL_55_25 TaxID=1798498 RepID=A0A1F6E8A3_9BACT|nr:MAG: hypothetical protein A3C20_03625 [Candidatus Kaiserbacteria bacterium RIFCSPHIGHO2_02_FULL_55_25]OGG82675.1 MAG: hypothetical protein A3A42_02285 [Candidatus Kaiserbacteria bacterium RIFCSPLOWO2_01_FULL_55_25]